jgi:deoxyribodipyrimidine photolyase-related protein
MISVWILGDQLRIDHGALTDLVPSECVVFMVESLERAQALPYHKQKLVLVWSAMRHFAEELRAAGYTVDYHAAQPDARTALEAHLASYQPQRLRLMETAEYGRGQRLADLARALGVDVEITPNTMFLSDRDEFQAWAAGKTSARMETFYRRMRRRTGLLMDGEDPVGGEWNYDKQNRETPPSDYAFPELPRYPPDAITREVLNQIEREFPDHFGSLDAFAWPVTRTDAEAFAQDFFEHRLDCFGPYEDAMVTGERALCHSLLSPLINLGLLEPLALCREAERRYHAGEARLNSVEGFIRQLIGWREFVYQVYHWQMPGYLNVNHFNADLPLPDFYWTAETRMACVAEAVQALLQHGINHHIQRLMITGNFALLAGIDPQAVNRWYHLAYVDAYEWVVAPNVLGMALYADGGVLATKPYAASANYIHKMSDYCPQCAYDHRARVGDEACPFNALYWDFLARNRERLQDNPRMNLMLSLLDRRDADELRAIRTRADDLRTRLRRGKVI